jgi:uncharacterized OB-fold protein
MSGMGRYALPEGLPVPVPSRDGLDLPFWEACRRHELWVQRCRECGAWQWGPEIICHQCRRFTMGWEQVEPNGRIYSWERVWHPVHRALTDACPYVVLLVELPNAGGVRMVGNFVGDPLAPFAIGEPVEAVFEDHEVGERAYTLVHWKLGGSAASRPES